MMTSRSGVRANRLSIWFKHGSNDGNIWQMCVAGFRVVRDQDISRLQITLVKLRLVFYGVTHVTQVHRDMRCVGDKLGIRSKYCAREIQPLLYVEG